MNYKKHKSFIKQNISLLQEYYHVETLKALALSLGEDVLVDAILGSGSGLLSGLWRGLRAKIFIKSKFPLFVGKRFKLIHPKNLQLGCHVWIRDDVSLNAHGKMIIGNNCVIGEKSELYSHGSGLKIGNGVGIGRNCYIAQLGGKLKIGNNVLIADSVRIYTLTHKYKNKKKNILEQGYIETPIVISDNVWIGSGAVIFNKVTIGEGSVIGANTVVTKDVPPYVVFAGVPGKIIKKIE